VDDADMFSIPVVDPGAQRRIEKLIRRIHPTCPVHIFRKPIIERKTRTFIDHFPGTVMFAVKSNPDDDVLLAMLRAGLTTFDAASIEEIRLIKRFSPSARIHFMHTVKSREAIREAYFDHQVRVFVIDTLDELHKILHETNLANDLEIFVRMALPKNKEAAVDFSAKFGATAKGSAFLLHEARLVCSKLGLMFHPGTQSTNPDIFYSGIKMASDIIIRSGVTVDALDVGGGFPVPYPGQDIPPLSRYIDRIKSAVEDFGLSHLDLYCEPGRALCAEAGLLVVRIEQRKDKTLYLNDGIYGGLIEAAKWAGEFRFPVSLVSRHPDLVPDNAPFIPFRFCGPTCDSLDRMKGPFPLPAHAAEGDWIIISMNGAYSQCCRTNFNGFGLHKVMMVDF